MAQYTTVGERLRYRREGKHQDSVRENNPRIHQHKYVPLRVVHVGYAIEQQFPLKAHVIFGYIDGLQ